MEPLVEKPKERKYSHEAVYFTLDEDKKKALLEKFWAKTDKKGPKECWEWKGVIHKKWYPSFETNRSSKIAVHRLSWVIQHNTPIPKSLFVCHSCDNKPCVNPNHLFLGNAAINVKDMDLKKRRGTTAGTFIKGSLSTSAKKKIIIQALIGNKPLYHISRAFKIARSRASELVTTFFAKHKDRSFLPEPLFSRYAHCQSWMEAKELRKKYAAEDKERSINPIQETG